LVKLCSKLTSGKNRLLDFRLFDAKVEVIILLNKGIIIDPVLPQAFEIWTFISYVTT